ncbi:hypothetical protein Syun_002804 [Stephania yunnanensis]|uniref:Uncharacterized protein n=1 Tax=Stephania yunnanensis TaxID=152371 RepID=A0AAP0PZ90_9MAGN
MVRNSSFSCEMGFPFSSPFVQDLGGFASCTLYFSAVSLVRSFPVQLLHARFLDGDVLGNW